MCTFGFVRQLADLRFTIYNTTVYTLITLILLVVVVALVIKGYRLQKASQQVSHQFDEATLILESLHDGLIECDSDMIPLRVNHATESMLGIEANKIVSRAIDPSNPANEIDKLLGMILYPPNRESSSYDVFLPAPSETKLRIFTVPKNNLGTKTVSGYIKIIRDVSIEMIVEKHKSDLVSIVSHQLLTPLTSVKWLLKSLLSGDAGPILEKQSDALKKGLSVNENMIGLVTNILDVTKVEQANFTYKKVSLDIVPFLREVISSRKEKAQIRNVRVEERFSASSVNLIFDKERMAIAFGNILDNAIDYSPMGVSILVTLLVSNGKVEIGIEDKGIGIPKTALSQLFTKFYRADNAKRTRTSGTGLGLYLAKYIIEDHGGIITVNSRESEGSVFTITLSSV